MFHQLHYAFDWHVVCNNEPRFRRRLRWVVRSVYQWPSFSMGKCAVWYATCTTPPGFGRITVLSGTPRVPAGLRLAKLALHRSHPSHLTAGSPSFLLGRLTLQGFPKTKNPNATLAGWMHYAGHTFRPASTFGLVWHESLLGSSATLRV